MVPYEVKAGEEFILLLEVKSIKGSFWGVSSNLTLPDSLSTAKPLVQNIGSLKPGDSKNITWVVKADENLVGGEYPVKVYLYSPVYKTIEIRNSVKVSKVSFTRAFQESVFTFMENSINFISENPAAVTLPIIILLGLGYFYYRFRK